MTNEIQKAEATQIQTDATPNQMLQMAIQNGADPAWLDKLLDVQMKYEADQARKEYVIAMSDFRSKCPTIEKTRGVDFTSQKGRTQYKFAGLSETLEKIKSALSECGLSHSWRTEQKDSGSIIVTCRVTHIAGHYEETCLLASPDTTGNKNNIQAIASTVSYLERYTLFALLGLASQEMDDDGGKKDVPKPPEKSPKELVDEAYMEYTERFKSEIPDNHYVVPEKFRDELSKILRSQCKTKKDLANYEWSEDSVKMLVMMLKLKDVIEEVK